MAERLPAWRWAGLLLLLFCGCATAPPKAPYPHEQVLTIIAEFKLAWQLDPLRYAAGTDLHGANAYRVTLRRLESLEDLVPEDYGDIVEFTRGQCLERLGDWNGAAAAFDRAAADGTDLAPEARERAEAARRMAGLVSREAMSLSSLAGYLNDLQVLDRRLMEWPEEDTPWPYRSYALVEAEQCRRERAQLIMDHRRLMPEGAQQAVELAASLTRDFEPSHRLMEHWLLVGEMFERLARDRTMNHPPTGHQFTPEGEWESWVAQAREAYRRVAQADGDPAKPEGQGRLRALDAWELRVRKQAR